MRLLTIAGVPVLVHWTLLVMLSGVGAWLGVVVGPSGALVALLAVTLTLVSVLWHELGHAFAARRRGVEVHEVMLMPLGGVTRLAPVRVSPRTDVIVSLAGPAASAALAAVAYGAALVTDARALYLTAALNALLAGFNLLPAFPLDGGRALRSLLVGRWGLERATRLTLGSGLGLALALFVIAWQARLPGAAVMAVYLLELQRQEWRLVRRA